jgi:predicted alpha/beta hydrolase family esterase
VCPVTKRVLITHTWGAERGETKWLFWLQKNLEKLGVKVSIQALDKRDFNKNWFADVKDNYNVADEHVFTIHQDPGSLTILKYVEYLSSQNIEDTHLLIAGTTPHIAPNQYVRLEGSKEIAVFSGNNHSQPSVPNPVTDAHLVILYSADPEQLSSGDFGKLKLKSA